ncbi:hypothetical protein LTR37_016785 [Vermiconidia calcicola]|uniref:Uncharacterized protein n=1 Tax=Vermiconidia calcicola TaxID=1690605 RepID=A0ACC3MLS5_9PEZI|nr:hypothetical protein LTR37_016785 [Vermiconidia calcicola]
MCLEYDEVDKPSLSERGYCCLFELPAELREKIWIHVVIEWTPTSTENSQTKQSRRMLERLPLRSDSLNKPLPPAITETCVQIRAETLPLYYILNTFELWRSRPWTIDTRQSRFLDWLRMLGRERTSWLRDVVLPYKDKDEVFEGVQYALEKFGFRLRLDVLRYQQKVDEYEVSFEAMGLPKRFGATGEAPRWCAWSVQP